MRQPSHHITYLRPCEQQRDVSTQVVCRYLINNIIIIKLTATGQPAIHYSILYSKRVVGCLVVTSGLGPILHSVHSEATIIWGVLLFRFHCKTVLHYFYYYYFFLPLTTLYCTLIELTWGRGHSWCSINSSNSICNCCPIINNNNNPELQKHRKLRGSP